MPKTETQEQPTAARPPRPEPRGRSEARALGAGAEAAPNAHSAFRLAPNTTGEASGADVGRAANYAQPAAAALSTAPLEAQSLEVSLEGVPGRAEQLEPESTESESFGRPRANVFGGLPLASLEGPSMASLDLTPSPVPRVSLVHANGAVDVSLVPGPHVIGSRNLPTVAARHVLGPARRVATPAITLPPQLPPQLPSQSSPRSVKSLGESRLARKLKTGMRSSKREIVLGLSIGVGLSVVLAGLGQSYVDNQRSWQAQGRIETAKLSALPQPAASIPAPPDMPEAPGAAQGSAEPPSAEPRSAEPRSAEPRSADATEPRAVALPSSHAMGEVAALDVEPEAPAPRRRASREKAPQVPKRAASRRVEVSPSDSAPLPENTSLSPSQSAGLGLDLPL